MNCTEDGSLRLFIAAPAPLAVQAAAAAAIEALRGAGDVRWVDPDSLHLTLRFLGETPRDQVQELKEALQKLANDFSQHVVYSGDISAFPGPQRPRVVWMGVRGPGMAVLEPLAQAVESACTALGREPQRKRFMPHLTLGRVRSGRGLAELVQRIETVRDDPAAYPRRVAWPIATLRLVQSIPQRGRHEHVLLYEVPLPATEQAGVTQPGKCAGPTDGAGEGARHGQAANAGPGGVRPGEEIRERRNHAARQPGEPHH